MFEHHSEPLLPKHAFRRRLARSAIIALGVVAASLFLGVLGYHFFAELPWLDALLNAAMILTGMGPVSPMLTPAAKLFATFYALFSGVIFLTAVGIVFVPLMHRLLHKFHLEPEDQ